MAKFLVFSTFLVFLITASVSAEGVDRDWTNTAGDRLWRNPANWNGAACPNSLDKAAIRNNWSSNGPIIDSGTNAVAWVVVLGDWASTADTVTMTGGSLTTTYWFILGYYIQNNGTFNISGGTAMIGDSLFIGFSGTGTLNMTGGLVTVAGTFGIAQNPGAAGTVNLSGGVLTANGAFNMGSGATMDITTGTLIVAGDQRALLNSYIAGGFITAYSGNGTLNVDFSNLNPGKTTLTAKPPLAGDFDKDGDVDIDDLALFISQWLDPNTANIANIDKTGRVDFQDFALLASNWVSRPMINWHVVQTQYPTDDFVISPYNAADFGIVSDGLTDVTGAIQTALNSINKLGGGTLFLPAGKYRIGGNLIIPSKVTLRGDWVKPEIPNAISGTILQAYSGRGSASGMPFISLSDSSAVKGVAIWYPEQLAGNIQPYPPTIQRTSGGFYTLENITFINSYFGFTTYSNNIGMCPFLRGIYGTPLKTGIEYDCLADIGRLETVHFSPEYWRYSGLPNSPTANEHAQWIYDNGTGIIIRRIDWSYFAYAQIEGYNIGVAFRPSLYDGVPPNGQCYSFDISNCNTGLYFENCSVFGMLLSRFDIEGAQVGVRLVATSAGPAMLHTFTINVSNQAIFNEGSGAVMIQNCQLNNKVISNAGYMTLVNCDFAAASPSHIEIGSSVKGASIIGNRFVGAPQIINNTFYPVYIDHTPQNVPALPEYDYKKPEQAFKPAEPNLYVLTMSPYNAKGNGTNDDTSAFEAAIADASANGGGTVFVPGGDYKLTRNLIIPTGVELRGVLDIPHATWARGSVLNIYSGRADENGTPFIQIHPGSGIRGLTFHYPEQIYNANDRVNYGLVPYPFMIRGLGSNIYVIDISATIPYQLLDLASVKCDNHFVDFIYSTALKTGIQVGGATANGQIHNCQFNPSSYTFCPGYYASIPPNTFADIHQYLWDHARPYVFGNMTGEVLHQNFVFGGYYGIHLIEESGARPSGYSLGMGADQSTTSLRVDAIGSAGLDMINTQLVTVDPAKGRYVETGNSLNGTFRLFNTACWGFPERSVIVNGGRLELQLFNNVKAGSVGYDLRGTGILTCIGGNVWESVSTLLLIEPGANAAFTSNILNTPQSQMPVNSSNVTSVGNLRYQ